MCVYLCIMNGRKNALPKWIGTDNHKIKGKKVTNNFFPECFYTNFLTGSSDNYKASICVKGFCMLIDEISLNLTNF